MASSRGRSRRSRSDIDYPACAFGFGASACPAAHDATLAPEEPARPGGTRTFYHPARRDSTPPARYLASTPVSGGSPSTHLNVARVFFGRTLGSKSPHDLGLGSSMDMPEGARRLASAAKRLRASFDSIREGVRHRGERGRETQDSLIEFLNTHLT